MRQRESSPKLLSQGFGYCFPYLIQGQQKPLCCSWEKEQASLHNIVPSLTLNCNLILKVSCVHVGVPLTVLVSTKLFPPHLLCFQRLLMGSWDLNLSTLYNIAHMCSS